MRWSLVLCLLLSSAALAKPRPKRTLGYIKNLISKKLYGDNTVVITRPELKKNETYQFFKIPGFDDILIKVSRIETDKPKDEKVKPDKPADPVIVKPEVAIIGSYLGTTTQKETLLAIEIVKSLLKSGILNGGPDDSLHELMIPMIPQPPQLENIDEKNVPAQTLHVNAGGQGHVFVPIGGVQKNTFVYPKLNLTPQTKYSYKQKGPEADMLYESHNNKDVIVTRTEKEPVLPQFLKLRISKVASIGADPYAFGRPLKINGAPTYPYYVEPSIIAPENNLQQEMLPFLSHRIPKPNRKGGEHENIGNNVYGSSLLIENNPVLFSAPLPIDTVVNPYYFGTNVRQVIRCKEKSDDKVCPYENAQKTTSNNPKTVSKPTDKSVEDRNNEAINDSKVDTNANRIAVNEFLKNYTVNGQLVSRYLYKQMNHHSNENYTEVKVGGPQTIKAVETTKNMQKGFVFIPPKVDTLTPSLLSINNAVNPSNVINNDDNAFTSIVKSNESKHRHFVPSLPRLKSNEKSIEENNFKQKPIVVFENDSENSEGRSNTVHSKTNEAVTVNVDDSKRGDIPGSTF